MPIKQCDQTMELIVAHFYYSWPKSIKNSFYRNSQQILGQLLQEYLSRRPFKIAPSSHTAIYARFYKAEHFKTKMLILIWQANWLRSAKKRELNNSTSVGIIKCPTREKEIVSGKNVSHLSFRTDAYNDNNNNNSKSNDNSNVDNSNDNSNNINSNNINSNNINNSNN